MKSNDFLKKIKSNDPKGEHPKRNFHLDELVFILMELVCYNQT